MRISATVLVWVFAAGFAAAWTYDEVGALVARAEAGEGTARAEGLATFKEERDEPLAAAARGRLLVLKGRDASFVMLYYLDLQRGFMALYGYINKHPDDPLPRVWRAASAVETNYILWNMARTRKDLEAALGAYARGAATPDMTARCYFLLGFVAKDGGDLAAALDYWSRAYAAEPLGPTGAAAAKMLALFSG